MPTTYAIPDGRTVMAATTYTGTGATQSISNAVNGVSFQPDFVWMKKRSAAESHILQNSITGVTKYLLSNSTAAEDTSSAIIQSFDSGGFTAGVSSTINGASTTYIGWQWNAGGSTVTNTDGTISSQVRANATAGFSVVTWTQAAPASTVGHGLGVAPRIIFVKQRNVVNSWYVYSPLLTPVDSALFLNGTNASTNVANIWNNTAATSNVFSLGTPWGAGTMVAYCFAAVAGYSAFGSYTGNGSTDGPFVFTGFRPRWVMIKRTDTSGFDWILQDTSRSTYNAADSVLNPNSSAAEQNGGGYTTDVLSNGFKLRNSGGQTNASGGTYVYACFAESPFKFANAR